MGLWGHGMNKVLFLLHYPGEGGTEKYVYDIITHYGVDQCVFAYTLDGPLVGKLEKQGVKCIKVKMRHPFDLLAARKVKRIAEQYGISVIHAQFLRENYIALLAKLLGLKAKVIWTYHVNKPVHSNLFSVFFLSSFNDSSKNECPFSLLKRPILAITNGSVGTLPLSDCDSFLNPL